MGYVDDEVGVSVHWEHSMEFIRLGIELMEPAGGKGSSSPGCPSDAPKDSPLVTTVGNVGSTEWGSVGEGSCLAGSTNADR